MRITANPQPINQSTDLPIYQSSNLPLCHQGEVWITQAWDLRDYVLKEGDMFLVTLPGTVLVQALKEAEVEISASLKTKPYRGEYVFYT